MVICFCYSYKYIDMEDLKETLEKLNLTTWFKNNQPPQAYSEWEDPNIDLIIENLKNKYSCLEFSVICTQLFMSFSQSS